MFGGCGIYYDRTLFDVAVDETQKLTHPTYTIAFAPRGVAPAAGQIAWNDCVSHGESRDARRAGRLDRQAGSVADRQGHQGAEDRRSSTSACGR